MSWHVASPNGVRHLLVMRPAIRMAVRELMRSRRFVLTSLAVMSLSFFGILLTEVFQLSAQKFLVQRAHESLAADVAVSAFHEFNAQSLQQIREILKPESESHQIEMMTMLSSGTQSLLVELKGIDTNFPLYGSFEVKETLNTPGLRVFPEVIDQLGVKLGETLQIGKNKLPITQIITDDPGYSQTTAGIAPKVYLPLEQLASSGLAQPGSQVVHRYYFKVPGTQDEIDGRVQLLDKKMRSEQIFIRTPEDGLRWLQTALQFFHRYVAILALLLAGLAFIVTGFQMQKWLSGQVRNATIMAGFGASSTTLIFITGLQLLFISLSSWVLSVGLMKVTVTLLNTTFQDWLPKGLVILLPPFSMLTFVFSIILSLLFLYPFVQKLQNISPVVLLQESTQKIFRINFVSHWLFAVLALMSFLVLIYEVFDDFKFAGWFTLGLAGFCITVWGLNTIVFRAFQRFLRKENLVERLPWIYLSRLNLSSTMVLVFSYLVVVTLTVVPQLKETLKKELQSDETLPKPSLFLMNIPENELSDVESAVQSKGLTLNDPSPFILAQLNTINGERANSDWFKKYPVRLSYREHFLPSETIVEGPTDFPAYNSQQKYPWISVERDYAARNNLKIGDILKFDIQGVTIEGEVHNLRRVDWASFQPNFFFQFQKGVLDDAPKTYIGTLKLKKGEESQLQFELARKFQSISVINISQTVQRVLDLAQKIVWPIEILAFVTIALSILLMISLVSQNLTDRFFEISVFRAIGASFEQILNLIEREFLIMLATSLLLGTVIGGISALLLIRQTLHLHPSPDIKTSAILLSLFTLLLFTFIYSTIRSVVRTELKIKS